MNFCVICVTTVINFARATGDLQVLSDVDLKLIALTYTLEKQIHGTKHLRDSPPPIHAISVRRLPEKDMPGWGSNVPNLEEWEALEHEVEDGSNPNSRILPLTDLNLNVVPGDSHSENGLTGNGSEVRSGDQEDTQPTSGRPRRYLPKKKEINIEGKKMVADGVDASQGQYDDNAGDWLPAVSRSTHRRYLRRKAIRELHEASLGNGHQHDAEENMENNIIEDTRCEDEQMHEIPEVKNVENGIPQESRVTEEKDGYGGLSSILQKMRLAEGSLQDSQEAGEGDLLSKGPKSNNCIVPEYTFNNNGNIAVEEDEVEIVDERLDNAEISRQMSESVDDASYIDDNSSEQSWMLRSLSDSSVACVTNDFAMQNVLLQMGLRLLAPGGMQIHQLHRCKQNGIYSDQLITVVYLLFSSASSNFWL